MPEGHTIHRLARAVRRAMAGDALGATSPQGRFTAGAALVDGTVLERTDAHGKHLFLGFAGRRWVHIHLGLYGRLVIGDPPAPPERGALRLRLVGPRAWADLRGATACEVIDPAGKAALQSRLGPDPLRRDADPDRAQARIARSRVAVGALLMDQAVLSGIGNVYRAEVLFRAGVDPYLPGRDLRRASWHGIWTDLEVLLRDGVRRGRIVTTAPDDRHRRVARDEAHYVYRRTGLPCRRCGTPVRTAVLVARNLYWCPVCQPPGSG